MEGKTFRLVRLDTMETVSTITGDTLRDAAHSSMDYPGLPIRIEELVGDDWRIKSVVIHPKPLGVAK